MSYKSEKINPYDEKGSKKEQVAQMFDQIAPTYDKLNGVLSLGIDNYWRFDAIKKLKPYAPKRILDIATGTGDFAILAHHKLNPESIIGIDISSGMLAVGEQKIREKGLENVISFEQQDCSAMTFDDNTFDAVTVAFGVRNFEDIDAGFQEVLRVLKPGGVFLFMELSTPERFPMKQLYGFYSKYIIPVMGKAMSTDKDAYEYLPESIEAFPQGREMMMILQKNGFTRIRMQRYTQGISIVYIAEKPIAGNA
ncbi:MAG: bifunctional demethylmenaquinone methyltransferase/2-methoxy-6-polyprenyl-1,4-benzoquinol methylase UbiE [Petrimonas sp.]|nr:bifunctional demethylmenaquinone methyltransferase/2-methoxy-6-polyprenyl-1,4-benzoquinol methylase UbiE [Petrimonas sp.]